MKTIDEIVIENIRREMKLKKLSQVDICKETKMDVNYFSKVINGRRSPGKALIAKVARALGRDPADLMIEAVVPESENLKFAVAVDVLLAFEKSTPYRRAIALAILTGDASHIESFQAVDQAALAFLKTLK